ncbi:MAG: DDE-type integrase/transposase/recombinase [Pseudanabaena sp. ELA748]
MAYFREVAKKTYQNPGNTKTKAYSVSTLKGWLRQYRFSGIDALYPAVRKDAGISKKIDAGVAEAITRIFTEYPEISASALYRMLVKRGAITKEIFTETTLRNYIRKNNLRAKLASNIGRKKFEMPAANMLWTMDFLHGPHVSDKWAHNSKRKTYLCAIIDDHSRLIVGAKFAFAENSMALATTLKAAVLQYGIPQKVYCDNGAAFSTHTLQLACARIGMALIHSKAYDSPSRGKIERFNRTVRQTFLSVLPKEALGSLEDLNTHFSRWLSEDYNGNIHSGIEAKPKDRFLKSIAKQAIRRVSTHELDQSFYESFQRKVKKDATISIQGCLFEVPCEYMGCTVEIRIPLGTNIYTLFVDDQPVQVIKPVCLIENAQKPHTGIHFSKKGQNNDSTSL